MSLFKILFIYFLNLTIIALKCCVSFCSIVMWISYMYTYILSLFSVPPSHPYHPSRSTEKQADLLVWYRSFPLAICFTHGAVYMATPLFQFIPPSPSPSCVHKSILNICISIDGYFLKVDEIFLSMTKNIKLILKSVLSLRIKII